jgi:cytochrome-b5 reductase
MSPGDHSKGQSTCPSEDASEDTTEAEPTAKRPRLEEAACTLPCEAHCNVKHEYASSCCIPTTWSTYPLLNVQRYNHDTSIFEFGLQAGQSLNLPVCACIMMANEPATDEPEEIRPYTSISDNSMLGKFQVLIKRYPAWGSPDFVYNYKPPGKMSNYVHNLSIGDVVRFKHMPENVKRSYPFTGVRTITMLAVGVGIAPMLRVLRAVLTTPEDTTQVVFLYGNRTVQDILMKEQLDGDYAYTFILALPTRSFSK